MHESVNITKGKGLTKHLEHDKKATMSTLILLSNLKTGFYTPFKLLQRKARVALEFLSLGT